MRRAVTIGPGLIDVLESPVAACDPGLVRIRVEAVGICGSDVHLFRGTHPYARYPQTQGHEVVGVVAAVGEAVESAPEIGTRVLIEPFLSCGVCHACRIGRRNACESIRVFGAHMPGALADLIDVEPGQLVATELRPEIAVFTEPVSIGLHAIERAQVQAGQSILVMGAGLVGLGAALAAIDRGARVAVADTVTARLDAAHALGAAGIAVGETFPHDLREFAPAGPEVIVEATGSPEVLARSAELVATCGTVVVVGISDQKVALPVIDFTRKEMAIIGARNSLGEFPLAEQLVARYSEDLGRAVRTRTFPLERAADAMVYADEERASVEKVIITVDTEGVVR